MNTDLKYESSRAATVVASDGVGTVAVTVAVVSVRAGTLVHVIARQSVSVQRVSVTAETRV